jgi:hypothetical protein
MDIYEAEMAPGTVGLLFDDTPLLTHAHVRAFVWPILLYRGAVRPAEVVASLTSVCSVEDLKTGAWDPFLGDYGDRSRAELLVDEVLGEMVGEGLCRYNEDQDIWVLTLGANRQNVPHVINVVTALDAMMPQHLLADLAKEERDRLPVPF